jgi:hypothetical protein
MNANSPIGEGLDKDDRDFSLELEKMLAQPLLVPPPGFERRVLESVANMQPASAIQASRRVQRSGVAEYLLMPLRYLTLLGGGAFAFSELVAFMFGLWTVSTAL